MAGTDKHQPLSFTKDERLKSKKRIEELFSDKVFVQNPILRIYFKQVESDCAFPAQFAFAAPKKLFPNAVDRNRIKRLMRESVRLQKPAFYENIKENNKQILLLLSYHSKEIADFKEIYSTIHDLLSKIAVNFKGI